MVVSEFSIVQYCTLLLALSTGIEEVAVPVSMLAGDKCKKEFPDPRREVQERCFSDEQDAVAPHTRATRSQLSEMIRGRQDVEFRR